MKNLNEIYQLGSLGVFNSRFHSWKLTRFLYVRFDMSRLDFVQNFSRLGAMLDSQPK